MCRLDLCPSDRVALVQELDAQEEAAAKKRVGRPRKNGGKLPPFPKGKSRDGIAKAAGFSAHTYERAKAVVDAAEKEPEKYGNLKEQEQI